MKIHKDIVDSFNFQIEKEIKSFQKQIDSFSKFPGFNKTLAKHRDQIRKLAELKKVFNIFSETGQVKVPME